MAHIKFNWERSCLDIPINFPEGDSEQGEQRRLAKLIKEELSAELRSVDKCFDEYSVPLFHADIIDYAKGEYLDLSHLEEKNSLGWTINPFAQKSVSQTSEILLFQPILAQEEVDRCFVETIIVKELVEEIENNQYKKNYLFCSHPRTGKTSLLSCLSTKAINKGFNVYWFSYQSSVPKISDFIQKLSTLHSIDGDTIVVFDNIHENQDILTLINDLRKQKSSVVIWCASRISEFVNFRQKWDEIKAGFIEKEMPGYLSESSIRLFLNKYKKN